MGSVGGWRLPYRIVVGLQDQSEGGDGRAPQVPEKGAVHKPQVRVVGAQGQERGHTLLLVLQLLQVGLIRLLRRCSTGP